MQLRGDVYLSRLAPTYLLGSQTALSESSFPIHRTGQRLIGAPSTRDEAQRVLDARTARMAGERLVEMYARLDLLTLQSDDVKEKLAQMSQPVLGGGMFSNLAEVVQGVSPLWSTLVQYLLILSHFAREPEGPTLIAICLSSFLMLSYLNASAYGASESNTESRNDPLADLACSPFCSVHCSCYKSELSTLASCYGTGQ